MFIGRSRFGLSKMVLAKLIKTPANLGPHPFCLYRQLVTESYKLNHCTSYIARKIFGWHIKFKFLDRVKHSKILLPSNLRSWNFNNA